MLPRERVIEVIEHRTPDRMPVYGWVKANLEEEITEAFGSVEAFEDKYEFDYAHLFGGPHPYWGDFLDDLKERKDAIEPADMLDYPFPDVDDEDAYQGLVDAVRHHKGERGRFVYVQTPGIFEILNGVFGIENHLMYLALYPDDLSEVYRRQAEWNRRFALNCLEIGIDMIHVSDDWGAQRGPMFSPETWRRMIKPYHATTARAVREAGGYLSLHSDGNIEPLVDEVIEMGYQVVHPWQESAGMDLEVFKRQYSDRLTVMGGLDVQTTVGFGDLERLEAEIERVVRMFRDGGLLFCTTHYVQDHCSIEELTFAFDTVYRLVREAGA